MLKQILIEIPLLYCVAQLVAKGLHDSGQLNLIWNISRARMVLQTPLPRLRLERQIQGDEDCLSAESVSSAVTTQMRR